MVGSGSTFIEKTSQAPLFKPQSDMQNVYGAPNNNDFFKSRMFVSEKKNNEKRWTSQNIGPGLTKQYDIDGTHGFNSGLMSREAWQPKSVDELRTINNPKLTFSLDEHVGPAHSAVQTRSEHAKINKNRPDTHFEHGPNRYFTSKVMNKQALQPKSLVDTKENNRKTTNAEYYGVAGAASLPEAKSLRPTENKYNRIQKDHIYDEFIGAPSSSVQIQQFDTSKYDKKVPYRSTTNASSTPNINLTGHTSGMVYNTNDKNEYSKKELLIDQHSMGIVSKVGAGGQPKYDPNDIPNPTIKESTLYSTTENPFVNKDIYEIMPHQEMRHTTNRTNTSSYMLGGANNGNYGTVDQLGVYNQRNNNSKVTDSRRPNGNINVFNNSVNYRKPTIKEKDNLLNRLCVPANLNPSIPNRQLLGNVTLPKEQKTTVNDYLHEDLLSAFKENPYTHKF